jgi:anti-sigma28 factor (negative regulator of flagellin synthesis)
MKVSETPIAVPAAATKVVSGSGQADALDQKKPVVADRVSISSSSVGMSASDRAQRVQEIITAVKNGQYYPSPQQIAQELVSDAELEAHLRSIVSG